MRTLIMLMLLATSVAVADEASDRALAERIRTLTNRSADGLSAQMQPNGGVSIDLKARFQHAYLAQQGPDGELQAACVGSIGEANAFFGRDLETGAAVQQIHAQPQSDLAKRAAAHGMTALQYQRYWNLIEQSKSKLAPDAATFSVVNNDGAGEGFNDPSPRLAEFGNAGTTLGQQRLNVFSRAGLIWGGFVDSNVTIQVRGNFDPLTPCGPGGGVLGSAGPLNIHRDFPNAPFANTFYPAPLANKLAGADQNAANPDIGATFNSSVDTGCLGPGTRFYYGLDNATPSGTINLLVVVLHEIAHGMGSLSFTDAANGAFLGNMPDIWARFMLDRNIGQTWLNMTAPQRVTSAITPNNLFWDGPSVRIGSGLLSAGAEAGTGRVELFTPSVLQGGSSVSHWGTVASPNLLMEPSINVGLPLTLDLTRQQMRDIGWYRDTTSDLVRDQITTVTPNSGSVTGGGNATISWTNTGGFNRNVTLELSTDGGANFGTVIASDVSNNGSFNWSVPNISTTQARIRVREHDFAEPVGVSSANFSIGGGNTAPVFTPGAAIARQQGSPAGAPVTVGTVSDAQTAPGALTVTQIAGGTASGVTISGVTNSNGTVSASLAASCAASSGTVRFQVFDGALTATGDLQVNVSANAAPVLGTYPNRQLSLAGSANVNPSAAPSDNGSVDQLTASAPGFAGSLSAVLVTGVVQISNAGPINTYVVTVQARDNCNATSQRTFNLTVSNDQLLRNGFESAVRSSE